MSIYFALSKKDIQKGQVHYPKTGKYTHKLVHTSLPKLRKFIHDNFTDSHSFSYCIVNELSANIDNTVVNEPGTVSLKLPFSFTLSDKSIRPLY